MQILSHCWSKYKLFDWWEVLLILLLLLNLWLVNVRTWVIRRRWTPRNRAFKMDRKSPLSSCLSMEHIYLSSSFWLYYVKVSRDSIVEFFEYVVIMYRSLLISQCSCSVHLYEIMLFESDGHSWRIIGDKHKLKLSQLQLW